jgi:hypothetical protein
MGTKVNTKGVTQSLKERLLEHPMHRTSLLFALDAAKSSFSCRVFPGQAAKRHFPQRREGNLLRVRYEAVNIVALLGYQLEYG